MDELIVCTSDRVDASGAPEEIKILPLGQVHSQKGDFTVDDESFELMNKQFKERGLDLVIDYEHQTLQDVQAPAGGWIKELYKGADAIIAKVEWTKKAAEYLANKEYKYLSPVVLCRKKDGKAVTLHSVALTNTPAIDGMFALVNSIDIIKNGNSEGGNTMDLKKLIELLGLDENATEEDVLKAVKDAKDSSDAGEKKTEEKTQVQDAGGETVVANKSILEMLSLKTDAKTEDVTAAIMALKLGSQGNSKELLALKQQMHKKEVDSLVMAALTSGKITAAQKEEATTLALKDIEGFKKFMDIAPAVVQMGSIGSIESKAADQDLDYKALKNIGISKEDIEKYKDMED